MTKEFIIKLLEDLKIEDTLHDPLLDGHNSALQMAINKIEEVTKPIICDEHELEKELCVGHEIWVCQKCGDVF